MVQQNYTTSGGDDDLLRTQSKNAGCGIVRDTDGDEKHSSGSETPRSTQNQLASITISKFGNFIHSSEARSKKTIRNSISNYDDNNDSQYSGIVRNTSRYSTWLQRSSRSAVLFAGASLAGLVLFINTIMLVVALASKNRQGLDSSPIYIGNCHKANNISVLSHVLINIMSTLLLGASNFAMQVLAAPTREEVDRAHSKGKWLDIGVPSLHNVRYISKTRRNIYLLLCLSSIPLHLLYNSAVFTLTSTNSFDGALVFEDFLNSTAPYNTNTTYYSGSSLDYNNTLQGYAREAHTWSNLSRVECAKVYQNLDVIHEFSNVLLIADQNIPHSTNITKGFIEVVYGNGTFAAPEIWRNDLLINGFTKIDYSLRSPPDYPIPTVPLVFAVRYCLAKPQPDHCQIHFSPAVLIVVIVFNILKTICLFVTAYRFGSGDRTLVVLGDAIESFLNHPSDAVKGICTANRTYFAGKFGRNILGPSKSKLKYWFRAYVQRRCDSKFESPYQRRVFDHKLHFKDNRKWSTGVSKSRWYMTVLLISSALLIGSWLLVQACITTPLTAAEIWSRGFGNIYGDSIVMVFDAYTSVVTKIVFVNAPQVVLSVLFFLYNALLTSMLVNLEYVSYSTKKKPLRVSTRCPNSEQRNTYYLQLPYRYGVPLLGLSCALHYTMSQALYVVDVMSFIDGIPAETNSEASIFYSELGIIMTLSLGVAALTTVFVLGFCRRYTGLMPLGGTCSASIAAACWRPSDDSGAALKEVQWGELVEVIENHRLAGQQYDEVREQSPSYTPHLCFTSMEVTPARADVIYR